MVFGQRQYFSLPLIQNDELDRGRVTLEYIRIEKGSFHNPPRVTTFVSVACNQNVQATIDLRQIIMVNERLDDIVTGRGGIKVDECDGSFSLCCASLQIIIYVHSLKESDLAIDL